MKCRRENCPNEVPRGRRNNCSDYCYKQRWNDDNRDYQRLYRARTVNKRRDTQLRLNYGIGSVEWESLFSAQNASCAICGSTNSKSTKGLGWHTDHCHTTGKVRGILCAGCNRGIGGLEDSVVVLRKAIEYLERNM